VMEFSLWKR